MLGKEASVTDVVDTALAVNPCDKILNPLVPCTRSKILLVVQSEGPLVIVMVRVPVSMAVMTAPSAAGINLDGLI